jgi:hypothetical protein
MAKAIPKMQISNITLLFVVVEDSKDHSTLVIAVVQAQELSCYHFALGSFLQTSLLWQTS